MKMRNWILAAALLIPLSGLSVQHTSAADLGIVPPVAEVGDPVAVARDYISRRAVLLMIRATFDVIQKDDIPSLLAQDLQRIGASGPSGGDLDALDYELLSEASFYIVSLRYIVEGGGVIWPGDRAESTYVNNAAVRLKELTIQLVDAVNSRADPLPVMRQVDTITAWTEGYSEVPPELDHFAGRDALVERTLAEHGPRVPT